VTDRHHFDNPVYCYPTGAANGGVGGAAAAVGGLNNARIRNDLGGTKNNLSNLERAKLGPNSLDDDCSEGNQKSLIRNWCLTLFIYFDLFLSIFSR